MLSLLSRSLLLRDAGRCVVVRGFAVANTAHDSDIHHNDEVSDKASAVKKRHRPTRQTLYGIHPVEMCLDEQKRKHYKVLLSRKHTGGQMNENLERVLSKAESRAVPIKVIRDYQLDNLTNHGVHQGIAIEVSPLSVPSWNDALESFGTSDDAGHLCLYLDRVQDPMNMGAIIRTAVVLGVHSIFVPQENSCRLGAVVAKASSGALECAPLASVDDASKLFSFLHRLGWDIVGTDSNCTPLGQLPVTQRNRLLVVGNEGSGVDEDLVRLFTTTVSIPTAHPRIASLNVSVAAGVLISHFVNKTNNFS